jgi:UDP-N-acetylmuramyl pentapeptide phosphotransferase/UDP-N-acetylglucosamine-1-phosphate transferase
MEGSLVIYDFGGLFYIYQIPSWIGWIFTLAVIVVITNAYNLIDGIDGLAGGLGSITSFFFGLMVSLHRLLSSGVNSILCSRGFAWISCI